MAEQLNVLSGQLRKSQSELQVAQMTIQNATAAISDLIDNPTDSEVAESTMETLNKALEDAETEQVQVIKNALSLINKIQGLYTHKPIITKSCTLHGSLRSIYGCHQSIN